MLFRSPPHRPPHRPPPPPPPTDQIDKEGGFHKIALKASKDDLTVATREGYYAPEQK